MQYYFVTTLLLVPYYSQKLIQVNTAVTIIANLGLMLLFPAGFLKLHSIIAWIFIGIVYIILFAACSFIAHRTTVLFKIVEEQGEKPVDVLHNVQSAFDSLEESSGTYIPPCRNLKAIQKKLLLQHNRLVKAQTHRLMKQKTAW